MKIRTIPARFLLSLLLLSIVCCFGCATFPVARDIQKQSIDKDGRLPKIRIVPTASIAVLSGRSLEDLDMPAIFQAIEDLWNSGTELSDREAVPARVVVESTGTNLFMLVAHAYLPLVGALLGIPTSGSTQSVKFAIEIDNQVFRGKGEKKTLSFIYVPQDPAQRAFSTALTQAVKQAASEYVTK